MATGAYLKQRSDARATRLKESVAGIARRFVFSGPRSGWTALKAGVINASIAAMNARPASRVYCPRCGWQGWSFKTLDCGQFLVPQAVCPNCGSHERHRMMRLLLERRPPRFLAGEGRVLHFAPEQMVLDAVLANPRLRYFSFDIALASYPPHMRNGATMDLHHIPLPDNVADGIFCLHVLEHVTDDHACLRELHRVLKPGGEAVIMVPFMMDQTETEEYGAPDPDMFDHVRGYSPLDFKHRLGLFDYEEITPESFIPAEELTRFHIPDSQVIYLCRKK